MLGLEFFSIYSNLTTPIDPLITHNSPFASGDQIHAITTSTSIYSLSGIFKYQDCELGDSTCYVGLTSGYNIASTNKDTDWIGKDIYNTDDDIIGNIIDYQFYNDSYDIPLVLFDIFNQSEAFDSYLQGTDSLGDINGYKYISIENSESCDYFGCVNIETSNNNTDDINIINNKNKNIIIANAYGWRSGISNIFIYGFLNGTSFLLGDSNETLLNGEAGSIVVSKENKIIYGIIAGVIDDSNSLYNGYCLISPWHEILNTFNTLENPFININTPSPTTILNNIETTLFIDDGNCVCNDFDLDFILFDIPCIVAFIIIPPSGTLLSLILLCIAIWKNMQASTKSEQVIEKQNQLKRVEDKIAKYEKKYGKKKAKRLEVFDHSGDPTHQNLDKQVQEHNFNEILQQHI